ncbi:MAG: OadG family protein [Muribaculaceae bacterium]|nr:OadG family protein [Muribaculaceae bacterium]
MRKKILLSAALGLALLGATPATAGIQADPDQQYREVSVQGDQTEVEGDWVPSQEVNTVQESELTRKAIQAEKARNAAENDKFGGAITIIAMCIVLAALIILSILFLGFGKISSKIQKMKKREAHGVTDDSAEDHHDELDSGEVIAAIAMALAEHMGQGHDLEDTKLTIRRMRKAYSPWNSKIYGLREVPELKKASRR